jgi:fucose permease
MNAFIYVYIYVCVYVSMHLFIYVSTGMLVLTSNEVQSSVAVVYVMTKWMCGRFLWLLKCGESVYLDVWVR